MLHPRKVCFTASAKLRAVVSSQVLLAPPFPRGRSPSGGFSTRGDSRLIPLQLRLRRPYPGAPRFALRRSRSDAAVARTPSGAQEANSDLQTCILTEENELARS